MKRWLVSALSTRPFIKISGINYPATTRTRAGRTPPSLQPMPSSFNQLRWSVRCVSYLTCTPHETWFRRRERSRWARRYVSSLQRHPSTRSRFSTSLFSSIPLANYPKMSLTLSLSGNLNLTLLYGNWRPEGFYGNLKMIFELWNYLVLDSHFERDVRWSGKV